LPTWAKSRSRIMLRRRTRLGLNARQRMRAGGPRAQGRQAASWPEWAAIRELVFARAGWRCQACGVRRRLDVHHLVKRSQGGSDFDLDRLVALCRWCHDQTDAPYERGRLVVTALGAGQFTFEVIERVALPFPSPGSQRLPTWAKNSALER
jgi:hypothetical protein